MGHLTKLTGRLLLALLAANVLFQQFQPQTLTSWEDSDSHQAYFMTADREAWPAENGVASFQTYGPLYRYLSSKVSPTYQGDYYLAKTAYLTLILTMIFQYLASVQVPAGAWVLSAFFALFNFPDLGMTPLTMFLWALALPKTSKRTSHLWCGCVFSSLHFLYKPALGLGCMLQIFAVAVFHPYLGGLRERARWSLIALTLLAALMAAEYVTLTSGGLHALGIYCRIALEDGATYSQWHLSPSEWPNFFTYGFPLILLAILAALAGFKVEGRRGWIAFLVFPLLFMDYKHAYIRADITNIGSVFQFLPLLLFFALLRFWGTKPLRMLLLVLIAANMALGRTDLVPYNTPYRHPRHFWLLSPSGYADRRADALTKTRAAFQDYLRRFAWVKQEVQGGSLLVVPAHIALSQLGTPYLLPSSQNLYAHNNSLRSRLDLQALQERPPQFILFRDRIMDERPPMSNRREFYLDMLRHYDCIARDKDFFLFRQGEGSNPVFRSLTHAFMRDCRGRFVFDLPDRSLVYLRAAHAVDWHYRLRSLLLKGDSLLMAHGREGSKLVEQRCNFALLDEGAIFPLDMLAQYSHSKATRRWVIEFKGRWMDLEPQDPVHLMGGSVEDLELEIGAYELVPGR